MMTVLAATNNAHKLREIREIFSDVNIISLEDAHIHSDAEENGETFTENALIKARTVYNIASMPVLSDDSGICVNALNGAPGVRSARFAGVHGDSAANNKLLLKKLEGVSDRKAQFVCAVAFICDKGEFTAMGTTEGEILLESSGVGGFGYDPLFYSYDLNKSFGEASEIEKNSVSHRARALIALKAELKKSGISL